MTVYVEYAFLDNFAMDFLLLFFASVTLKLRFRWWRLILGATVGTVIALITVYLKGIVLYVTKALCLFAMCFVTVGWGKKLFWHILLTLAYTFVTGGAILGIFNLLNVDYATQNGFYYNATVPLFVYLGAILAVVAICYSLHAFVMQTKQIAPFLQKVVLHLDKAYDMCGFCDSGNSVMQNGVPVCFIAKRNRQIAEYFAAKLLRGETVSIEVQTLTGRKTVVAIESTLEVRGEKYGILLALSPVKGQTQYDVILNSVFCSAVAEK